MYSEDNIQRFKAIDHIRLRPGMYLGSTDKRALLTLLEIVLDNSLDAVWNNHVQHVHLTIRDANTICVEDDGSGLPVDLYEDSGMTIMELLINRERGTYYRETKKFGGSFGQGLSVINALSSHFIAEVRRDGYLWRQEYRQGKKVTEVTQVRPLAAGEDTGTTITFTPDFTILEPNNFDYTTIANRLREFAFLMTGLTLTLRDERSHQQETFYAPNGVADFVRYLNAGHQPLHELIHASEVTNYAPKDKYYTVEVKVDLALQYSTSMANCELGFVNTMQVNEGTHLAGFHAAMVRLINRHGRTHKLFSETEADLSYEEISGGLTAVVSISHPHASIQSQADIRLMNSEVHGIVASVLSAALEHHPVLPVIVQKCLQNRMG